MKVLFTANTELHLELCHLPYLKYFKELGYEVHVATKKVKGIEGIDKYYDIPIKRSPFHFKNIVAYFKLKRIIKEEKYDLIHTHTPTASVLTRLAARKMQKRGNTKVFYTAHGFHFYKGCPLFNWLTYYPIEKWLSKYTDLLLTMNEEDYSRAKEFSCPVLKVPGVGFHEENFYPLKSIKKKNRLKKELGIKKGDIVITYVAEISKRKNQRLLLDVIRQIDKPHLKVLLIGNIVDKRVEKMIHKYHLEKNIFLLGFQENINLYLEISDIIVSTSKQEGLPLHIMEAMYKGKNIVASKIRGNTDLIKDKENGFLFDLKKKEELKRIILYYLDYPKHEEFKKVNTEIISQYTSKNVLEEMKKIYQNFGS